MYDWKKKKKNTVKHMKMIQEVERRQKQAEHSFLFTTRSESRDPSTQGRNSASCGPLAPPPSSPPRLAMPSGTRTLPLTRWASFFGGASGWLAMEAGRRRRGWAPGRRRPRWAGGNAGHRGGRSSGACRRTSRTLARRTGTPRRRPPAPGGGCHTHTHTHLASLDNAAHSLVH